MAERNQETWASVDPIDICNPQDIRNYWATNKSNYRAMIKRKKLALHDIAENHRTCNHNREDREILLEPCKRVSIGLCIV